MVVIYSFVSWLIVLVLFGGETKQLGERGTKRPWSQSFGDRHSGRLEEGHGHRLVVGRKEGPAL
jgi:hypothetical protein